MSSPFRGFRPDLFVVVVLLGAACGDVRRFENEGRICVAATVEATHSAVRGQVPSPQQFGEGQPLFIEVMMPTCLSSSCSHDIEAVCAAAVDGAAIVVSSHGSFREGGVSCSADCGFLLASCSTGPLAAGTYEVRHGAERISLTIPSMAPVLCAGQAPFQQ
jgi:hypothetical protein